MRASFWAAGVCLVLAATPAWAGAAWEKYLKETVEPKLRSCELLVQNVEPLLAEKFKVGSQNSELAVGRVIEFAQKERPEGEVSPAEIAAWESFLKATDGGAKRVKLAAFFSGSQEISDVISLSKAQLALRSERDLLENRKNASFLNKVGSQTLGAVMATVTTAIPYALYFASVLPTRPEPLAGVSTTAIVVNTFAAATTWVLSSWRFGNFVLDDSTNPVRPKVINSYADRGLRFPSWFTDSSSDHAIFQDQQNPKLHAGAIFEMRDGIPELTLVGWED